LNICITNCSGVARERTPRAEAYREKREALEKTSIFFHAAQKHRLLVFPLEFAAVEFTLT
jgi:hypothetical protein